ncbi:MAG: hypothetical protein H6936_03650 [Burkholderiales bacterium]|nr:hypothetical protein [Burkholderiales bacterium]
MTQWLYNRLKDEDPNIQPGFALQSSINWSKALRIICDEGQFERSELKNKYRSVQRRSKDQKGDTNTFECTFMAFHQYASLTRIFEYNEAHYDLIRSAIISWYYGIYNAASAMIAATDGSAQETHTSTANAWNHQLNTQNQILEPFNYCLSTLVKKDVESEIKLLREENSYDLNQTPTNYRSAYGACISYLKGTADREREILENRMKNDREFKNLKVPNFRTKVAREYRDKKLQGKGTAFLHQAFRFRGKANYRDAIYLSYGRENSDRISELIENLIISLKSFIMMSCHYSERRVERGTWKVFYDDIKNHSALSVDPDIINVC